MNNKKTNDKNNGYSLTRFFLILIISVVIGSFLVTLAFMWFKRNKISEFHYSDDANIVNDVTSCPGFIDRLANIRNQSYSWFTDIPSIKGYTILPEKVAFILKINIAYKKDDRQFSRYIASRTISIVDSVTRWMSDKTSDYLRNNENKCAIKYELINIIKNLLYEPEKLFDISFSEYQILDIN